MHWHFWRPVDIISSTVQVQLLHCTAASAMEKDPVAPYVLCRQETTLDSGKATFSNRFVLTPCLASLQFTQTCWASANLMSKWCFQPGYSLGYGSSWKPKCVALDELLVKLHVTMLASAESHWWSLWHRACHRLIYPYVWLEHLPLTLSTSKEARAGKNLLCV